MLENIKPAYKLEKSDYKKRANQLRLDLLNLQYDVRHHNKPVFIIIAGDDRSGRHETINKLSEWLDPRYLRVNAYEPSQHEDDRRPFFWRFWRDLPGAGEIAIFLRDWTSTSIVQSLNGEISAKKLKKREKYIRNFEKKHTDDGALIIKCWLHIQEDVLRERVLENRSTPYFDLKDELALKNYPEAISCIEETLAATSATSNEWHIVDGADPKSRNLEVGEIIKTQIEGWLQKTAVDERPIWSKEKTEFDVSINMPPSLEYQESEKPILKNKLKVLQHDLRKLMMELRQREIPVVIVFEGWDAAGKGGAIRRVVAPLDAGFYRIYPVAKPSEEEYRYHYLWRFWKKIPSNGGLAIFDRSWYGRVLVERVEGFASDAEWQRAYKEINDFEEQLKIHKMIVLKFWMNISKDEQLKRFNERQTTKYKNHKITDEDFRNRARWDDYVVAVEDMIALTSTKHAPWKVINSDVKERARVEVLETIVDTFKAKLKT